MFMLKSRQEVIVTRQQLQLCAHNMSYCSGVANPMCGYVMESEGLWSSGNWVDARWLEWDDIIGDCTYKRIISDT